MPLLTYLALNSFTWTTCAWLFTTWTLGDSGVTLLFTSRVYCLLLCCRISSNFSEIPQLWCKKTKKQKNSYNFSWASQSFIYLQFITGFPDCRKTFPVSMMVQSAWPLILHKALWIPLLFTSISSCLCNAADIQQCIVMPECPSALIPFKAHPTGWHQGLGCHSNVWHLFKQWDKLASLPSIHPYWFLPRQFCCTGGFSLFGFLFVFSIYRTNFFSHPPTPFST